MLFLKARALLRQFVVGCRGTRPFRCDQEKPHNVGENEFLAMLVLRGKYRHRVTHRQWPGTGEKRLETRNLERVTSDRS